MPFWFSQVVAFLSAKGGERVVENPQKDTAEQSSKIF